MDMSIFSHRTFGYLMVGFHNNLPHLMSVLMYNKLGNICYRYIYAAQNWILGRQDTTSSSLFANWNMRVEHNQYIACRWRKEFKEGMLQYWHHGADYRNNSLSNSRLCSSWIFCKHTDVLLGQKLYRLGMSGIALSWNRKRLKPGTLCN